jgi:hypothetical protein
MLLPSSVIIITTTSIVMMLVIVRVGPLPWHQWHKIPQPGRLTLLLASSFRSYATASWNHKRANLITVDQHTESVDLTLPYEVVSRLAGDDEGDGGGEMMMMINNHDRGSDDARMVMMIAVLSMILMMVPDLEIEGQDIGRHGGALLERAEPGPGGGRQQHTTSPSTGLEASID